MFLICYFLILFREVFTTNSPHSCERKSCSVRSTGTDNGRV